MSPFITSPSLRPLARRTGRPTTSPSRLNGEVERTLRDMAFVLQITERVKAEMVRDRVESPSV